VDIDLILAALRVFAGLVIAGHGAQKVLGWFGGPGMTGFGGMVRGMGMRPVGVWTAAAAYGELVGGLLLAIGLLTGIAAGVLVLDMLVAIWKVHWAKGFWITNGGMEHALTNGVIYALFGLLGPGAYSLDAPLRLLSWNAALFAATIVIGLLGIWGSTRPEAAAMEREAEARRRRAA
jgi:putative oxidoreductase